MDDLWDIGASASLLSHIVTLLGMTYEILVGSGGLRLANANHPSKSLVHEPSPPLLINCLIVKLGQSAVNYTPEGIMPIFWTH